MLRRTPILAILMMAAGGLLGYAAASGKLNLFRHLSAAAPPERVTPQPSEPKAGTPQAECCLDGANKGERLALALHNQKVAAEAQASGKKPNILVIWGDDIGIWNISHNSR